MSDMVERVARTIYESHNFVESWDSLKDVWRPAWLEQAHAAIAAMRDPTEEMLEAPDDGDTNPRMRRYIWRAMIDEALR